MSAFRSGVKIFSHVSTNQGRGILRIRSYSDDRQSTSNKQPHPEWAVRPAGTSCPEPPQPRPSKSWFTVFCREESPPPQKVVLPKRCAPKTEEDSSWLSFFKMKEKPKKPPLASCRLEQARRKMEAEAKDKNLPIWESDVKVVVKEQYVPKITEDVEQQPKPPPQHELPKSVEKLFELQEKHLHPIQACPEYTVNKTTYMPRLPYAEFRPPDHQTGTKWSCHNEEHNNKIIEPSIEEKMHQQTDSCFELKQVEPPKQLYSRYKSVELNDNKSDINKCMPKSPSLAGMKVFMENPTERESSNSKLISVEIKQLREPHCIKDTDIIIDHKDQHKGDQQTLFCSREARKRYNTKSVAQSKVPYQVLSGVSGPITSNVKTSLYKPSFSEVIKQEETLKHLQTRIREKNQKQPKATEPTCIPKEAERKPCNQFEGAKNNNNSWSSVQKEGITIEWTKDPPEQKTKRQSTLNRTEEKPHQKITCNVKEQSNPDCFNATLTKSTRCMFMIDQKKLQQSNLNKKKGGSRSFSIDCNRSPQSKKQFSETTQIDPSGSSISTSYLNANLKGVNQSINSLLLTKNNSFNSNTGRVQLRKTRSDSKPSKQSSKNIKANKSNTSVSEKLEEPPKSDSIIKSEFISWLADVQKKEKEIMKQNKNMNKKYSMYVNFKDELKKGKSKETNVLSDTKAITSAPIGKNIKKTNLFTTECNMKKDNINLANTSSKVNDKLFQNVMVSNKNQVHVPVLKGCNEEDKTCNNNVLIQSYKIQRSPSTVFMKHQCRSSSASHIEQKSTKLALACKSHKVSCKSLFEVNSNPKGKTEVQSKQGNTKAQYKLMGQKVSEPKIENIKKVLENPNKKESTHFYRRLVSNLEKHVDIKNKEDINYLPKYAAQLESINGKEENIGKIANIPKTYAQSPNTTSNTDPANKMCLKGGIQFPKQSFPKSICEIPTKKGYTYCIRKTENEKRNTLNPDSSCAITSKNRNVSRIEKVSKTDIQKNKVSYDTTLRKQGQTFLNTDLIKTEPTDYLKDYKKLVSVYGMGKELKIEQLKPENNCPRTPFITKQTSSGKKTSNITELNNTNIPDTHQLKENKNQNILIISSKTLAQPVTSQTSNKQTVSKSENISGKESQQSPRKNTEFNEDKDQILQTLTNKLKAGIQIDDQKPSGYIPVTECRSVFNDKTTQLNCKLKRESKDNAHSYSVYTRLPKIYPNIPEMNRHTEEIHKKEEYTASHEDKLTFVAKESHENCGIKQDAENSCSSENLPAQASFNSISIIDVLEVNLHETRPNTNAFYMTDSLPEKRECKVDQSQEHLVMKNELKERKLNYVDELQTTNPDVCKIIPCSCEKNVLQSEEKKGYYFQKNTSHLTDIISLSYSSSMKALTNGHLDKTNSMYTQQPKRSYSYHKIQEPTYRITAVECKDGGNSKKQSNKEDCKKMGFQGTKRTTKGECTHYSMPGCTKPLTIECKPSVKKTGECRKLQPPRPSYSECLKEPRPPRIYTECNLKVDPTCDGALKRNSYDGCNPPDTTKKDPCPPKSVAKEEEVVVQKPKVKSTCDQNKPDDCKRASGSSDRFSPTPMKCYSGTALGNQILENQNFNTTKRCFSHCIIEPPNSHKPEVQCQKADNSGEKDQKKGKQDCKKMGFQGAKRTTKGECTHYSMPGCTKPLTTECKPSVKKTGECRKLQPPRPSYSECLKEPLPPRIYTECNLKVDPTCDGVRKTNSYDGCNPPDTTKKDPCPPKSVAKEEEVVVQKPKVKSTCDQNKPDDCKRASGSSDRFSPTPMKCYSGTALGNQILENQNFNTTKRCFSHCIIEPPNSHKPEVQCQKADNSGEKDQKKGKQDCKKMGFQGAKRTTKGECTHYSMPGCTKPLTIECKPTVKKTGECRKLQPPRPSYSECLKETLPPRIYTECNLKVDPTCDGARKTNSYDGCNPPDTTKKDICPPKPAAKEEVVVQKPKVKSTCDQNKPDDCKRASGSSDGFSPTPMKCYSGTALGNQILENQNFNTTKRCFSHCIIEPPNSHKPEVQCQQADNSGEKDQKKGKQDCKKMGFQGAKRAIKAECTNYSMPGCTKPLTTECKPTVKKIGECNKQKTPRPSYSDCIKEPRPPQIYTECILKVDQTRDAARKGNSYDGCNPPDTTKKDLCPPKSAAKEEKVVQKPKEKSTSDKKKFDGCKKASSSSGDRFSATPIKFYSGTALSNHILENQNFNTTKRCFSHCIIEPPNSHKPEVQCQKADNSGENDQKKGKQDCKKMGFQGAKRTTKGECTHYSMPGCTKPLTTECKPSVKKTGECRKLQPPRPSYSECLKEPLPPRIYTECNLKVDPTCDGARKRNSYDGCNPPDTTKKDLCPPKSVAKEEEVVVQKPKVKSTCDQNKSDDCKKASGSSDRFSPTPMKCYSGTALGNQILENQNFNTTKRCFSHCIIEPPNSHKPEVQCQKADNSGEKDQKKGKQDCKKMGFQGAKRTTKGECTHYSMPGCTKPLTIECKPTVKKTGECRKLQPPRPSYSECLKETLPPRIYTECNLKVDPTCDGARKTNSYDGCNPPDTTKKDICPPKPAAKEEVVVQKPKVKSTCDQNKPDDCKRASGSIKDGFLPTPMKCFSSSCLIKSTFQMHNVPIRCFSNCTIEHPVLVIQPEEVHICHNRTLEEVKNINNIEHNNETRGECNYFKIDGFKMPNYIVCKSEFRQIGECSTMHTPIESYTRGLKDQPRVYNISQHKNDNNSGHKLTENVCNESTYSCAAGQSIFSSNIQRNNIYFSIKYPCETQQFIRLFNRESEASFPWKKYSMTSSKNPSSFQNSMLRHMHSFGGVTVQSRNLHSIEGNKNYVELPIHISGDMRFLKVTNTVGVLHDLRMRFYSNKQNKNKLEPISENKDRKKSENRACKDTPNAEKSPVACDVTLKKGGRCNKSKLQAPFIVCTKPPDASKLHKCEAKKPPKSRMHAESQPEPVKFHVECKKPTFKILRCETFEKTAPRKVKKIPCQMEAKPFIICPKPSPHKQIHRCRKEEPPKAALPDPGRCKMVDVKPFATCPKPPPHRNVINKCVEEQAGKLKKKPPELKKSENNVYSGSRCNNPIQSNSSHGSKCTNTGPSGSRSVSTKTYSKFSEESNKKGYNKIGSKLISDCKNVCKLQDSFSYLKTIESQKQYLSVLSKDTTASNKSLKYSLKQQEKHINSSLPDFQKNAFDTQDLSLISGKNYTTNQPTPVSSSLIPLHLTGVVYICSSIDNDKQDKHFQCESTMQEQKSSNIMDQIKSWFSFFKLKEEYTPSSEWKTNPCNPPCKNLKFKSQIAEELEERVVKVEPSIKQTEVCHSQIERIPVSQYKDSDTVCQYKQVKPREHKKMLALLPSYFECKKDTRSKQLISESNTAKLKLQAEKQTINTTSENILHESKQELRQNDLMNISGETRHKQPLIMSSEINLLCATNQKNKNKGKQKMNMKATNEEENVYYCTPQNADHNNTETPQEDVANDASKKAEFLQHESLPQEDECDDVSNRKTEKISKSHNECWGDDDKSKSCVSNIAYKALEMKQSKQFMECKKPNVNKKRSICSKADSTNPNEVTKSESLEQEHLADVEEKSDKHGNQKMNKPKSSHECKEEQGKLCDAKPYKYQGKQPQMKSQKHFIECKKPKATTIKHTCDKIQPNVRQIKVDTTEIKVKDTKVEETKADIKEEKSQCIIIEKTKPDMMEKKAKDIKIEGTKEDMTEKIAKDIKIEGTKEDMAEKMAKDIKTEGTKVEMKEERAEESVDKQLCNEKGEPNPIHVKKKEKTAKKSKSWCSSWCIFKRHKSTCTCIESDLTSNMVNVNKSQTKVIESLSKTEYH